MPNLRLVTPEDLFDYYRHHSACSDPGPYASYYDELPEDIPGLCQVLQNAILHMFWISEKGYGITHRQLVDSGRRIYEEFNLETAAQRLQNILELDPRPLTESRAPIFRSVGCCRDYALMLVSILRYRGIPARVRTGVARYFFPGGRLEDHYICDSWDPVEKRWRLTDPQRDAWQVKTMGMTDFPRDQFLTGWETYQEVVSGRTKPDNQGFPPVNTGLTYGVNKLFTELVGVTGQEIPVFAWWGIGDPVNPEKPGDEELIGRMVEVLQGIDRNDPVALEDGLRLVAEHLRLKRPPDYSAGVFQSELCQ